MTVIEKLQKLQNRAAKLVTNSPFDATALPVIRALQWPTVRELIDFESQKMVFRSLKVSMTPKIFFTSTYQIDMPELIGKVFFAIWGVFPHVFASQKVRFWGSAEKSRVRLRGMGLAGRDVQSGRTCEAELLLTVSFIFFI